MKRASTLFLQVVIILVSIIVIAFLICVPLTEGRATNLNLIQIYTDPFILYGYTTSIIFFIGMYKVFKLLGFIGHYKLYSTKVVATLKSIKFMAIVLAILILLAGAFIKLTHNKDDDPAGFIAICILTTFISIVFAIVSGVYEKKLQKVIDKNS